jgi:hypothetical protein
MLIHLKHKIHENKTQFLQQIATSRKDENLIMFIEIVADSAIADHENQLVSFSCLSVRLSFRSHGTSRLPLDIFMKFCI